jgi:SAM-dependent methyltransferase
VDVANLYRRHVQKPPSYFQKYRLLPLHLNDKSWRWEGKDFPRIPCILDFKEWLSTYNLNPFARVLSTDPTDPELEFLEADSVDYAVYDGWNNDLHTLDLPEKDFSLVTFHQTLEHLWNPFLACARLRDHLRPGGYLFTSVPTINIPHLLPHHFWGMTPIGLVVLLEGTGFEVLELGFWGNERYISLLFSRHEWPDYRQLMTPDGIPNEERNCCQCWALARKR